MTLLQSPALAKVKRTGMTPSGLIIAELMKIRTTSSWWWFLIAGVVFTAQALVRNGASHYYDLHPPLDRLNDADQAPAIAQAAYAHTPAGMAAIGADMMTSGQFVGALLVMIVGVLVVTNEFSHNTASATFMTNPRRATVLMAKSAAAACFGALFWAVSTLINTVVTAVYVHRQHLSVSLGDPVVIRSVLLNLLAYALWATFGMGLGAVLRSQTGSVITGMAVYLAGTAAVAGSVQLIYNIYPHVWVFGAAIVAPAIASLVMITPGRAFDHAPPQWAGLAVMIGYALVLTTIGIAVTRRRDVA